MKSNPTRHFSRSETDLKHLQGNRMHLQWQRENQSRSSSLQNQHLREKHLPKLTPI